MHIFQPDRYLLQKQLAEIAPAVIGRTLDVGAGTTDRYSGRFNVSEYVRMDIAPGPGIDTVGSIYHIPFPDASFDSVVSTQVFEHVADPATGARELHRILKAGGRAIITVPQVAELHEEPHDFFRYTCFGVEAVFVEAGFVCVKKLQRGGFLAVRAQILIRYFIDRFSLYNRPIVGRIAGKLLGIYGRAMLYLDTIDTSVANRKHAIGWCYVFQKPRQ
jgi:SAM-dependent methyltransferase